MASTICVGCGLDVDSSNRPFVKTDGTTTFCSPDGSGGTWLTASAALCNSTAVTPYPGNLNSCGGNGIKKTIDNCLWAFPQRQLTQYALASSSTSTVIGSSGLIAVCEVAITTTTFACDRIAEFDISYPDWEIVVTAGEVEVKRIFRVGLNGFGSDRNAGLVRVGVGGRGEPQSHKSGHFAWTAGTTFNIYAGMYITGSPTASYNFTTLGTQSIIDLWSFF